MSDSQLNLRDAFGVRPASQNAVDLFRGEWSSAFPEWSEVVTGGGCGFHEDERVRWGWEKLGREGQSVLELGPLEGGHSYLLEQLGAGSVLALEANSRAFLKCLVAKELLGHRRTRFLLGDFNVFLENPSRRFDLCLACGVLYHQKDPIWLLRRIAKVADSVYLWFNYYDPKWFEQRPELALKEPFVEERRSWDGLEYRAYRRAYGASLEWKGFCGGEAWAAWLEFETVCLALDRLGFEVVDSRQEENPNGPAASVAARKRR